MRILAFGIALSFFVGMLLNGCAAKKSEPDVAAILGDPATDFEAFYEKFHSDSAFQMNHITFPLEGVPTMQDSGAIPEAFRWQAENWNLHKPFDPENGYKRKFSTMGDFMVEERIVHPNGNFGMIRRFAIISNEWHLIYYADMNQLVETKE